MTVEHRLFVGLTDILAVTCECKACKARLSLAPDQIAAEQLYRCPSCRRDWLSDGIGRGSAFTSDLVRFLMSLSGAQHSQVKGSDSEVGVCIYLELAAPRQ